MIYATGYEISFPFLDASAGVKVSDNEVDLYKFVFPPNHKHPTLAFIGLIQPWGAIMPISEMQMRWVSRVFTKRATLPSQKELVADIKRTKDEMSKRYIKSARHTIQVDYVDYMDEIAALIGVYPSFWEIFKKDRTLLKYIYSEPNVPAQYRLIGPHSWDGAPEIVKTAISRSVYPTRTRKAPYARFHFHFPPSFSLINFVFDCRNGMRVSSSPGIADVIRGLGVQGIMITAKSML